MKSQILTLLSVLCWLVASCEETVTVSGTMPYHKEIAIVQVSEAALSPQAKALMNATVSGVVNIDAGFSKTWNVPFSGPSVDEALAAEDVKAVEGYDKALADLKNWQQTFQKTIAEADYGKGSFTLEYRVKVWRTIVLKESESVVFNYKGK